MQQPSKDEWQVGYQMQAGSCHGPTSFQFFLSMEIYLDFRASNIPPMYKNVYMQTQPTILPRAQLLHPGFLKWKKKKNPNTGLHLK